MTITITGTGRVSDTEITGASAGNGSVRIAGGTYAVGRLVGAEAGSTGEVELSGGARVTVAPTDPEVAGVQVSGGPGANGTLSLSGAATELVATDGRGLVSVADEGTGRLEIDGGQLSAVALALGGAAGSVATGRVTDGRIVLESGDTGSVDLSLGREAGSAGRLTVSGDSEIRLEQASVTGPSGETRLAIGQSGAGQVELEAGARLRIIGQDARLTLGAGGYGAPTAAESSLEIRSGASVVLDGGQAALTPGLDGGRMQIAAAEGTTARVRVDGPGSSLTLTAATDIPGDYTTGELLVGALGRGTMGVSNGAAVSAFEIEVGAVARGTDAAGQPATVTGEYLADVAVAGSGRLTIASGGTVTALSTAATPYSGIWAGRSTETLGEIVVEGPGSRLTSEGGAGLIYIGEHGTGRLTIRDGAEAQGFFVVAGQRVGSDGRITVEGMGSRLLVSDAYGNFQDATGAPSGEAGFLRIGRSDGASGALEIRAGGRVEVVNAPGSTADLPGLEIAREAGSRGSATVEGAGSVLRVALTGPSTDAFAPGETFGAYLSVGRAGEGSLTVSGGGTVVVSGEASRLFVGGRYAGDTVGGTGTGTMTVESGGQVRVEGPLGVTSIATDRGNTGIVIVSGAGSVLDAGPLLLVGQGFSEFDDRITGTGGAASLSIEAGGQVSAGLTLVGAESRLDGDGSLDSDLTVEGTLAVADDGIGTFTLGGSLALADGAVFEFDVDAPETADRIAIAGDADFNLDAIDAVLDAPSAFALRPAETVLLAEIDGTLVDGSLPVGRASPLLDLVASDGSLRLEAGSGLSAYQAQTVALLYEAGLDRDGLIDVSGLNFWIGRREDPDRPSERQLAQAFLDSTEFSAAFGPPETLSDEELVRVLYRNVLNREGEDAGVEFWTGRLADPFVTQSDVLLAFARIPENVAGSPFIEDLFLRPDGLWVFA